MKKLSRFLPFLNWFPMRASVLKADLIAGVTVALILIPQAMAYAQLAGLPAYYGLYAAFLPVMLGALWGSSSQLATGPAAIVSLLTGTALAPLALSGSEHFISLAILLAFMVGTIQLSLGVLKLGVIVNLLSHPVIIGFSNAAALIISLSQLNKLIGVPMKFSQNFIQDIWAVLQQLGNTHWPTLVMGLSAIAIMWSLKKFMPRVPGILIAVVLTTVVSWYIGYEHNGSAKISEIVDVEARGLANTYAQKAEKISLLNQQITGKSTQLKQMLDSAKSENAQTIALHSEIDMLKLALNAFEKENRSRNRLLRNYLFERVAGVSGAPDKLYLRDQVPAGEKSDSYHWRIKSVDAGKIKISGGGDVLGKVPLGVPNIGVPNLSWGAITSLFSAALVIALVGFMEGISIAKSMAASTRQRIDPNQELIGQGVANLVGSFNQSFPVSASFSRTAVNFRAGALTGMSSVFAGLIVLVTVLFLTPLLFHLPQSVLAAIIMMAVAGLINLQAIKHAWQAHHHDGIAAVVTFVATLFFAPNLDLGILVGASLAIILYLSRTMKPRVLLLGRHSDGTLRDAKLNHLRTSDNIVALRFDGCLYFGNVPYFEDAILETIADKPKAQYLLLLGDGINQLDASGEELIQNLVKRLRENGVTMAFCGMKKQVMDIMNNTGLADKIGSQNFFRNENLALEALYSRIHSEGPDTEFTLLQPQAAMKG